MVALAGPPCTGAVGVGLIALGTRLQSTEAAAVGVAFALHLIGLFPGCSDENRTWILERRILGIATIHAAVVTQRTGFEDLTNPSFPGWR